MSPDNNVEINRDGIEAVFAEIAAKMEKIDREIRAEHSGQPADEVASVAAQRFAAAGLNMTSKAVQDYAASVEAGEPFTIELS